jgi:tRNA(Arg) A34 adenosine deaminase TadA
VTTTPSTQVPSSPWLQPTDDDFQRIVGKDKVAFLDRLLGLIENEIVPMTREGAAKGNKLFGGAILKKSDLSTVVVATNTETENPLLHGEITTINRFYALSKDERPAAGDTIFIATHEPCPLCLSGISWGGFDNFFYLFSYEDSRDAFGIPHDIRMLDSVFRCPEGSYNEKNQYWSAWGIPAMVASLPDAQRVPLEQRIASLRETYDGISDIYQQQKAAGTGADVPLK